MVLPGPVGGQAHVDWITEGTEPGRRITAAIPPFFGDYATLTDALADEDRPRDLSLERRQDLAFAEVLRRHSGGRPWWIGYLDTGASDIVFWQAPKVTLYYGWSYVFVLAAPRPSPGLATSARRSAQLEVHRTARGDVPG